jgi:predicted site-specific integrase-resolvase
METLSTELPRMLNETAVAETLSVSIAALRRWRREGRGPRFVRLERCVRYSERDVENYLSINASERRELDGSALGAGGRA